MECLTVDYAYSINTAKYPSDAYKKLLTTNLEAMKKFSVNNTDFHKVADSFLSVRIYFRNPWYTEVTTSLKISTETLVGLIGNYETGFLTGLQIKNENRLKNWIEKSIMVS